MDIHPTKDSGLVLKCHKKIDWDIPINSDLAMQQS